MNGNDHKNDERGLQAPQRLVVAMKQLPVEPVFVPPSIDNAIATAARRHLQRPRVSRNPFPRWLLWPAFAAACLALVFALLPRAGLRVKYAREDMNHDGRVDILDAFALARQVRDGKTASAGFDLNGDGVVDERDAAAIAARAVKLEKGDRS